MTSSTDNQCNVIANRKRSLLGRFRKDSRGSVAIEFVMLALPFSLLVFAIIESCIAFGAQQVMANSVDDVARDLRVNNIKMTQVNATFIREKICDKMSLLVTSGCPGLVIDMKKYTSFDDVPTSIPRTGNGDVDESAFAVQGGDRGEKMHMRIFYRWPYITDFIGNRLAGLPNNKTLLYASATWQNEV
jgi:Flp pilus assembly protein TadG